jgi:hypothetical protein
MSDKKRPTLSISTYINEDATTERSIEMDVESHDELTILIGSQMAALMDVVSLGQTPYKKIVSEVPVEALPTVIKECREILEGRLNMLCDYFVKQAFLDKENE